MPPDLTPEAWAQIRHAYEHTERPVPDICLEHGTTPNTLRDRVRRWGWTPRRRAPIPSEGPPPAPAARIEPAAPLLSPVPRIETTAPLFTAAPQIDTAAFTPASPIDPGVPLDADPALVVPRLQGAVARVLPAIEATVAKLAASTHPRELERAARALASLTRTLRELNALLSQHAPPADDGPENLEEFRSRLAKKIDAMIASRPNRAGDGTQPASPMSGEESSIP